MTLTAADMLSDEEFALQTREKREPHRLCLLLRQLRAAAGLSLSQIEKRYKMSAVVLGAYERGDREPPLRKLEAALGIFGYRLTVEPIGPGAIRGTLDIVAELRAIANQLEETA